MKLPSLLFYNVNRCMLHTGDCGKREKLNLKKLIDKLWDYDEIYPLEHGYFYG